MKIESLFPCNGCGCCCRQLKNVPELSNFDRGDGTCIHLKDNLCMIYETRPDICRVSTMYELFYKSQMSKEAFYHANLLICKQLQIQAGLPQYQQVKV